MTTPHGHPDFQNIVNASAPNLLAGPGAVFPVGHTLTPVVPVANWGSVLLAVTPTAGQAKVFLRHWQDAAGLVTLGNDQWPVNVNTGLAVRSPLRGPFMQVDVFNTGAGAMTANASALMQSTTASELTFPVGFQSASDINRTLAASTNRFYQPPFIAAGRAMLFFRPYDTAAKLRIVMYQLDETGAALANLVWDAAVAAPYNKLLEVPDSPLGVQVFNDDGAAPHTYDFALIVPPQ